jgi:trk system potassium uptake protein TrkH
MRSPVDPAPLAPGRHFSAGLLAIILATLWFVSLMIGMIVLRLPGATVRGNEMSIERAVFTAVNASTLCGFPQSRSMDDYHAIGQICLVTLTVIATLAVWLIGALGLVKLLRWNFTTGQIVRATIVIYIFAVAWGAAVLAQPGMSLSVAAFQAASALGNSGLTLGHLPAVTDWRTFAALMPLAAIGGLSVPVLMEVFDASFGRRAMSIHTLIVLALLAAAYILGVALLSPWWQHAGADTTTFASKLASGSALAIDSRSTGFPLVSIANLSRPQQWLLIGFMLIGAAPASAAGGMGVTVLHHFFRGAARALKRQPGLRITGIAAIWIVIYLILVGLTLLALLGTVGDQPADRLVFLAASSVGAVGLAHEPITITGPGLYILSTAMVLGRTAPLLILWYAAKTTNDADVGV